MRDMEKAYSYRFYPTPEQESLLRRTLGCVRLVYNKALHERTQAWYEKQERGEHPSFAMSKNTQAISPLR
jgi:putative transposase